MKSIIVLLLCCALNATQGLKWKLMAGDTADVGPGKVRDCALGYHGAENRLFIFGGKRDGKILNETWYYEFGNRTWKLLSLALAPENRFTMAFGVWNNQMFISTGEGPGKVFYNDVWKFDFVDMQWTQLPQGTNPPEKRYGAAGGIYPGESLLWMTHGFADIRYSNTFTYDLITNQRNKWVEEFTGTNSYNPKYPHARCIHGATPVTPDHLLIYGGCLGGGETGGPCPSSDTWLFSRVNKKWKRLEECFSPRMYPAMAPLPMGANKLRYRAIMYGGGQKRPIKDTDEFSVVWLDEAPMDEIGVFTLDKADVEDDEPDTKWERRRATAVNITEGIPKWRVGHSFLTVKNEVKNMTGVFMFGGGEGDSIWFLQSDVDMVDETEVIGSGCSSKYWSLIHFHGLFMFLGWGFLLVAGVFIARYFRHKDPLWFHLHRIFQVSGLLFTVGGFVCGVMSVPFDHFKFAHGAIGLDVFILGLVQAIGGALRPHKRESGDQSMLRRLWEFSHKFMGRSTLILALINISLGMFLAVVPTAVFAVWFGYLGAWVVLFFIMEIVKHRKACGKSCNPAVANGNYEMNAKL